MDKKVRLVTRSTLVWTLVFFMILGLILFMKTRVWGTQKPMRLNEVEIFSDGWIASKIRERRPVMNQWFSEAQKVADQTRNEKAKKVINFLKESSYLVMPAINSQELAFIVLENAPKVDHPLAILPLLPGDERINEFWKEKYESKPLMSLEAIDNKYLLLVIKSQFEFELDDMWKGVMLLHTGYLVDVLIHRTGDKFLKLNGIKFTSGLVSQLYGERYETMVAEEVLRLEKKYVIYKQIPKEDNFTLVEPELKKIFGPAKSETDSQMRYSVLWMQASFQVLEKYNPKNPEEVQANFLNTLDK